MIPFELSNFQRAYFGLDPIEKHWERVPFSGDNYRPQSILYFDGDTLKRHITSTDTIYSERQYNDLTKGRKILLPKTERGREKKLTAAVLEQRQPTGVYLSITEGSLTIGNYNTQTTFYSSRWEKAEQSDKNIPDIVSRFIEQSPESHVEEITLFKKAKRESVKFKTGDYFSFRLDRVSFGFGRVLLDINKVRKRGLLKKDHGLRKIMGLPVIVQFFAYRSNCKNISISTLDRQPKLPADLMMDNKLYYGEYEIIGHRELEEEEFEFPISYGQSIDGRSVVFLQWGLIHLERPTSKFHKYISADPPFGQNPYGLYGNGFEPGYNTVDVAMTIENGGIFDFNRSRIYKGKWDLRNPKNKNIKEEIFRVFGLDPGKSYADNCRLTGTQRTTDLIKEL